MSLARDVSLFMPTTNVDGLNPAPLRMYTPCKRNKLYKGTYQLVQDFFHQHHVYHSFQFSSEPRGAL